jgi:hypothetical protein
VLLVTVTLTAVPDAEMEMLVGDTLSVGSPAACEIVAVSCWPPDAVAVSVAVRALMVPLALAASVMLTLNSDVAPGSPVMVAALVVVAPPAKYEAGSALIIVPPDSVNVIFALFDLPVTVTLPPALPTLTSSICTNSFFASCVTATATDVAPVAENVALVVRCDRPVWTLPPILTDPLPEPDAGEVVHHVAFAILFYFFEFRFFR